MEKWKEIKEFERYQVSSRGNIKSLNYGGHEGIEKILKPSISSSGYLTVSLYDNLGIPHTKAVHRLVAEAFIPNPENKPTVNHINQNPIDNNSDNLEWATYLENNIHAGRAEKQFKNIVAYNKDMTIFKEYSSLKEATEDLGIKSNSISMALTGKRRTCGGFNWRYKDKENEWIYQREI